MLKFLLIFILILLVLRFLGKLIIVSSFNKFNTHQKENFKKMKAESKKKEGQISIKKSDDLKSGKDGDYVDYEEVK